MIGLAIARELAARESPSTTLVLERHGQVGTETSSRNSEVIHAGLYYKPRSMKTRLCLIGRARLYAFCEANRVPYARLGKWVVAQDEAQCEALEGIHAHCAALAADPELGPYAPPVHLLTATETRAREPDVRAAGGALESPETGIVDSHGLMLALHGLFEDAGGVTALNSAVVGVEPLPSSGRTGAAGWRLTVRDASTGEESTIEAEYVVNSAGLGAVALHNLMLETVGRPERKIRAYYAKGNYFSYGASAPRVQRLIYPAPSPGGAGLGTHLTLDLAGRIRFGPDAEWVEDPGDLAVNAARLPLALQEIRRYLPGVDADALAPDYAGIRPKLGCQGAVGAGPRFRDFHISRSAGIDGWLDLLGMESPGLTSCLAIGEHVRDTIYLSPHRPSA